MSCPIPKFSGLPLRLVVMMSPFWVSRADRTQTKGSIIDGYFFRLMYLCHIESLGPSPESGWNGLWRDDRREFAEILLSDPKTVY